MMPLCPDTLSPSSPMIPSQSYGALSPDTLSFDTLSVLWCLCPDTLSVLYYPFNPMISSVLSYHLSNMIPYPAISFVISFQSYDTLSVIWCPFIPPILSATLCYLSPMMPSQSLYMPSVLWYTLSSMMPFQYYNTLSVLWCHLCYMMPFQYMIPSLLCPYLRPLHFYY